MRKHFGYSENEFFGQPSWLIGCVASVFGRPSGGLREIDESLRFLRRPALTDAATRLMSLKETVVVLGHSAAEEV